MDRVEPGKRVALRAAFLDDLIKRSVEAETILQECGRLRLHRALTEAVQMYQEQIEKERT